MEFVASGGIVGWEGGGSTIGVLLVVELVVAFMLLVVFSDGLGGGGVV